MKKILADGVTRKHAQFDAEYREEALRSWRSSGRSAARFAAELGIRPELLYKWSRVERGPTLAGTKGPPARRTPEELEAEIQRLRSENAKLLEQREVLKKSLGILCEPPLRGMPGSSK